MKTIGDIKIFSSAKEMSIARYTEFQKYLAKEASTEGLLHKLERSKAFIEEGKKDESLVELGNAIFDLNTVLSGVNNLSMAFAVLVSEIGLKMPLRAFGITYAHTTHIHACNDITESGLVHTISLLRLSYGEVQDEVETLKKKSIPSLRRYFRSISRR